MRSNRKILIDNGGSMLPVRKPRRRRNAQPERALHTHVGQMLKWLKPKCVYFSVPNGAADLGRKMGGILRAQHKIYPGVADWIFLWGFPAGRARFIHGTEAVSTCGAIELKIDRQPQSKDQQIFEMDCKLLGIPYRIARSVDEVVAILVEWGRLPPGTVERIRGKAF